MKSLLTIIILTVSSFAYSQWPALSTPNVGVSITAGNEHNYKGRHSNIENLQTD